MASTSTFFVSFGTSALPSRIESPGPLTYLKKRYIPRPTSAPKITPEADQASKSLDQYTTLRFSPHVLNGQAANQATAYKTAPPIATTPAVFQIGHSWIVVRWRPAT